MPSIVVCREWRKMPDKVSASNVSLETRGDASL